MQRRIDKTGNYRQAVHCPEKTGKIITLKGKQSVQGLSTFNGQVGHNHLMYMGQALCVKKHMLRTAQTDAFGTVFTGTTGIVRIVGIGPDTKGAK